MKTSPREPHGPHERPSRYRSGAYSPASLPRLDLSDQARELAEAARALVPTVADAHARDGEFVADAAELVRTAHRLLESAVLHERMKGTSWERIGVDLGGISRQVAQERYAEAEREFRLRVLHAWLRPEIAGSVLTTADRLAQAVARLTAWAESHHRDSEDDLGPDPVSAGLAPMSTAERVAMIAQATSLLAETASGPGFDSGEHRVLEVALCHRKIELYEDLAIQDLDNDDVLAALADTRARLTELREETPG
jgi:hypothetical protein